MISDEQIEYWLSKKKWTDSEKQAFLDLIDTGDFNRIRQILEMEFKGEQKAALESDISERMLKNIRRQVIIAQKPRLVKLWKPVAAAAAALIILLGGLSYLYFNNFNQHQPRNISENRKNEDNIIPGGNKAILTLADGSIIILDSARNGIVSRQGRSKIVKPGDGKVVYDQLATENENLPVTYNTITTPRGGQYQLQLPDGSLVWLNAASSITFPTSFTGNSREVRITGEAYFEVKHEADKPFRVSINDIEVQVLGTHFNINAYEDEGLIKTTLLEGSVRVNKAGKSVLIRPGEQAQVYSSGYMDVNRIPDIESVMAWKNGKFNFREVDLRSIMHQLERWYDVKVTFKGSVTNEEFVGIVPRNVNISEILNMLELAGNVKFEVVGKNIMVTN